MEERAQLQVLIDEGPKWPELSTLLEERKEARKFYGEGVILTGGNGNQTPFYPY